MVNDNTSAHTKNSPGLKRLALPLRLCAAIVAFWLVSTLADIASLYFDPQFDNERLQWGHIWTKKPLLMLWHILTTYLAFVWFRRHVFTLENWRRDVLLFLPAAAFWSLLFEVYLSCIHRFVFHVDDPFLQILWGNLNLYAVYYFFGLFSIAFVANAYYYYQGMMQERSERAELNLKLANTELMLYRAQLEPHFLFNALNSIAALVRLDRREQATNAIARLSTLLRSVLDVGNTQLMPLDWELDFARHYIALQKLRFGKKLDVHLEVHDISRKTRMPVLLLQPLIENAIAHGPLADSALCELVIEITQDGQRVHVTSRNRISDSGHTRGTGLGLLNLEYRLAAQFGDDFTLLAQQVNHNFQVRIDFPLLMKSPEPSASGA